MKSILASWLCVRLVEDIERESGRWWEADLKANSQKMLLPHFPSGSSGNAMCQFNILYKIQWTYFFKWKFPPFLYKDYYLIGVSSAACYLTFRAPHSSTASASSTTVIRKFGVCRSSLKRRPFSKTLQPIERDKGKLKKFEWFICTLISLSCASQNA